MSIVKGLLVGGICGALFAAIDGLVLGAIVASVVSAEAPGSIVAIWTGWFAFFGAVLGAAAGGVFAGMAQRLKLDSPAESKPD
jgi:hypothetical protein